MTHEDIDDNLMVDSITMSQGAPERLIKDSNLFTSTGADQAGQHKDLGMTVLEK